MRGQQWPLVVCTRECHQQIHDRIERGDSLRVIARKLRLSRGTVLRFAGAADVDQILVAATHRSSVIDDYRLHLHQRCRTHLRPYRAGAISMDAPLHHPDRPLVADWIMCRPEHLINTEHKCLNELCERSPALATTTEYACGARPR